MCRQWSLCVAVLVFLPLLCRAEDFRRITASHVIYELRQRGVPVCFELVHRTGADDITLEEYIKTLQAIPSGERTGSEKGSLRWALERRKEGMPAEKVVEWRKKRFDFSFPGGPPDPEKILQALIVADPDYRWEKIRERYVVFPKVNSMNRDLAGFRANNLTQEEFYTTAVSEQIAKPCGMRVIHQGRMTMCGTCGSPWYMKNTDSRCSLVMSRTDSFTALAAVVEVLGPDYFWEVSGAESDLVVAISRLDPPIAPE